MEILIADFVQIPCAITKSLFLKQRLGTKVYLFSMLGFS